MGSGTRWRTGGARRWGRNDLWHSTAVRRTAGWTQACPHRRLSQCHLEEQNKEIVREEVCSLSHSIPLLNEPMEEEEK